MKKRNYIKLFNLNLNENINNRFSKTQKNNAKKLFRELFDYYLKETSPNYPFIFHNTTIERYDSIKEHGLVNELNYFSENDNDNFAYGEYDERGEEVEGISVALDYRTVIDRLYPDPEWLHDVIVKTGNPSDFNKRNIEHEVILCVLFEDILNLDINETVSISDISNEKRDYIIDQYIFNWLYVKGEVSPNLITIYKHPDLLE